MTNRKRSLYNLLSATVGQLLAIAIGFLLPKLIMENFGSATNGLISSINQLLVYLGLFEAGVGAVTMQALYGHVARKNWGGINGVLSATHIYYRRASVYYLAGLVGLAVVYPLLVAVDLSWLSVFLVIIFCGLANVVSFYVQGKYVLFLRAEGKSYIISNLGTLIAVLAGLSKAGLILLGFDVVTVLAVAFVIHLIQVVYITRYIKRNYPSLSVAEQPDFEAISQKNYMLIHQISGLIFQNTDVLILTMVSGLKVVSVYSIYKLVMSQLSHLVFIVQNSFDFVLGQTYQTDKQKYGRWINVFESYLSAAAFAVYAVVFFVLYAFVGLYTGGVTDIRYADHLLVLLFVVIELLTVMRTPMLQTINYAGHFKLTTPQTIIETVINLTVSLLAVSRFGMYGVLAGTVAALLYRTNDIILYANKKLLERSALRTYLIHALNIAMFVGLQFVFGRVLGPMDTWLELIKAGVLGGLIALPAFVLMQTLVWSDNRRAAFAYVGRLLARFRQR